MNNELPFREKNIQIIRDHCVNKRNSGILLAGTILFVTAFLFWQLVYAAVIAISLAVVLMPAQRFLTEKIGSGYAALTVCISSLASIALFFLILINTFVVTRIYIFTVALTISDAIQSYQPGTGTITGATLSSIGSFLTQSGSAKWIEDSIPVILQSLSVIAQSLPGIAIQVFIIILMLFLLLKNGEEMAARLSAFIPDHMTGYFTILCGVVTDTMYGVYVVNISIAIFTFFITLPFFWYLGYGEFLFWAFICGVSHLFPFFGPQMITVILAVYALARGDMHGLLLVAIVGYPLISGLQDFWIRPRLLARRIAIHPALMMIGLFGGMLILGPIGLIIGPLIIALADAAYNILLQVIREKENNVTCQD